MATPAVLAVCEAIVATPRMRTGSSAAAEKTGTAAKGPAHDYEVLRAEVLREVVQTGDYVGCAVGGVCRETVVETDTGDAE